VKEKENLDKFQKMEQEKAMSISQFDDTGYQ